MRRIFLLFIIFVLAGSYAFAQSCTQRLKDAEADFEAGKLTKIPDQLNNCLKTGGFSAEEEIRARKLLTLVYIFMDDESNAEDAFISLLRKDPEHDIDETDPQEFKSFYKQFQVDPILRISGKISTNLTNVNILQEYSPNGSTGDGEATTYSYGTGFGFEATADKYLGKGFEVSGGPQFRLSHFNVAGEVTGEDDYAVSYKFSMAALRVPVMMRYVFWAENVERKKVLPYVFAGLSADYLLKAGTKTTKRDGGIPFSDDLDFKKLDVIRPWNYSLLYGVGAKLRVKKVHFITFEARYDNSRRNFIKGNNRYVNPEISFDLANDPFDFHTNHISFSAGLNISLYNPKRLISE